MTRRAARKDENQNEIVAALTRIGCVVHDTSGAGNGFPDIVCGYRGRNYLLEIKNPEGSPAQRKLTPKQHKFHAEWKGQLKIVTTVDEAINAVTELKY